jgi:WD40 repeat protein
MGVASHSGKLAVWDRPSDQVRGMGPDRSAYAIAFSPDGRQLAVCYHYGADLMIFDPTTGKDLFALPPVGLVETMAYSPDGELLAVASGSKVVVWDIPERREVRTIRAGQAFVRNVAFHPNGQLLATAGDIPTLSIWDMEGRSRGRFNWEVGKVQALSFAPDGMTAAAGGSSGRVAVWDVEEEIT